MRTFPRRAASLRRRSVAQSIFFQSFQGRRCPQYALGGRRVQPRLGAVSLGLDRPAFRMPLVRLGCENRLCVLVRGVPVRFCLDAGSRSSRDDPRRGKHWALGSENPGLSLAAHLLRK